MANTFEGGLLRPTGQIKDVYCLGFKEQKQTFSKRD